MPAGKYTILIGEAETDFTNANERQFSVTIGNQVLATNIDIITAAGGPRKVVYLHAQVVHENDSLRGPLTVKFVAGLDNVKFNTFEIEDVAGNSVIKTRAANLAEPLMVAAKKPLTVSGPEIWKDPKHSLEARVQYLTLNDLVHKGPNQSKKSK